MVCSIFVGSKFSEEEKNSKLPMANPDALAPSLLTHVYERLIINSAETANDDPRFLKLINGHEGGDDDYCGVVFHKARENLRRRHW